VPCGCRINSGAKSSALCYIPPSTGVGAEEIKAARDLVNKLAQRELEGRYLRGRAWNNPDPKEAAELAGQADSSQCRGRAS
jgi:hypothetical protein